MYGCPVCDSGELDNIIIYETMYDNHLFKYLLCNSCLSVYVSPTPNNATLSKIYLKKDYHDKHYSDDTGEPYLESVDFFSKYIDENSTVLDYGCGTGVFMNILREQGYNVVGVEYNSEIALSAQKNSGCKVYTLHDFLHKDNHSMYNAIHLGDVLEHSPNPFELISSLLMMVSHNGYLLIEGPLERNMSPVFWASNAYRIIKKIFNYNHGPACIPPAHLFMVGEKQQLTFFKRFNNNIIIVDWKVYETGWPYQNGMFVKKIIAKIGVLLSGKRIFGRTIGNRFIAVLKVKHNY